MKEGFWKRHLGDVIVIGTISCLALALSLFAALPKGSKGEEAEITLNGKRMGEHGLIALSSYGDKTEEITIQGEKGEMKIGVKKDGICVLYSSCPSQYCVKQGWISEPGRPLVCAYNHVVINILGESEDDFRL